MQHGNRHHGEHKPCWLGREHSRYFNHRSVDRVYSVMNTYARAEKQKHSPYSRVGYDEIEHG